MASKKGTLKKCLAFVLAVCLIVPALPAGGVTAYASAFSKEAGGNADRYLELGEMVISKLAWEYDNVKSPAEFAQLCGRELYGDSDYVSAEDIHEALEHYRKNLGYDKDAFAGWMSEMGIPESFVKAFWTNYKGSSSKNIKDMTVTAADACYTGKPVKPAVKVVSGGTVLKKGTDYTVTYKNNTKIGKASAVVKGKGKYTGSVTVRFDVGPGKVSLSSVKANQSTDKITLGWAKVSGAGGYEIYYATAKNGDYTLLKRITNSSTNTCTTKKLPEGSTYYFKIRAYKTVGGKKCYNAFSAAKAAKLNASGGGSKPDAGVKATFTIMQADIVGDDVFLVWNNHSANDIDGIEVLRAESGSSNFQAIATLGKSALNTMHQSYIDEGAAGRGCQYALRAVSGGKYGETCTPKKAAPSVYKWYKGERGYVCCRPWRNGFADFTEFAEGFTLFWNCDWSYSSSGSNTYTLSMIDPGIGYEGYDEVYVTDEVFRHVASGVEYYALNDAEIVIE